MNEDIYFTYYKSPYGELVIGDYNDRLCMCDWRYRKLRNSIDKRIMNFFKCGFHENYTPIINETISQLEQYFGGERKEFSIPINFAGTPFQVEVWDELMKIPWGVTTTYLELSRKLGNEKAIRAVASANGANAISIIVPCHRVVGSDGSLVGYAGGKAVKKKLLSIENVRLTSQLDLFE